LLEKKQSSIYENKSRCTGPKTGNGNLCSANRFIRFDLRRAHARRLVFVEP